LTTKRLKNLFINPTFSQIIILGLLVHIVTAIFSAGFQHPDEHHQILELVNVKLGNFDQNNLTWDIQTKIRSWMQPFFYYIFHKAFYALNIKNPFFISTFIRVLSSILGWSSLLLFGMEITKKIKFWTPAKWLPLFLGFTWFLPYLHARTSSENISSALLF